MYRGSIEFGDYSDNEPNFVTTCRDAERGEKEKAITTITNLIIWIEQHPMDVKSNRVLLPRAYQALMLLQKELQRDKATHASLLLRMRDGKLISMQLIDTVSGRVLERLYPRG